MRCHPALEHNAATNELWARLDETSPRYVCVADRAATSPDSKFAKISLRCSGARALHAARKETRRWDAAQVTESADANDSDAALALEPLDLTGYFCNCYARHYSGELPARVVNQIGLA